MPFEELEGTRNHWSKSFYERCDELVSVRLIRRKRNGQDSPARDSILITMYRDAMVSLRIKDGDRMGFRMDHQTLDLMIYNKAGMLNPQTGRSVRTYGASQTGTSPNRGIVELTFFLIANDDTCRRIIEALGEHTTKYLGFRAYTANRDVRSAIVVRLTDQSAVV